MRLWKRAFPDQKTRRHKKDDSLRYEPSFGCPGLIKSDAVSSVHPLPFRAAVRSARKFRARLQIPPGEFPYSA